MLAHVILMAVPVLFAITLHEVAHGLCAKFLGDDTAQKAGRLSLNPLRHVDPVGTLLVPAMLFFVSTFALGLQAPMLFGWARPVPIGWRNLRNRRRDMALVCAAGPAANLVMAIGWILVLVLLQGPLGVAPGSILISATHAGIIANTVMLTLNLIPIPPLDGSRILASALTPNIAARFLRLDRLGLVMVAGLVVSGALHPVIGSAYSISLGAARWLTP